jgi:hypothetical protein
MPEESSSAGKTPEPASGPRPLSRRASRLFVIASILFILAGTLGGTYYLIRMTDQALNAPMDSIAAPSDTAMTSPADTVQTAPADTLSPSSR